MTEGRPDRAQQAAGRRCPGLTTGPVHGEAGAQHQATHGAGSADVQQAGAFQQAFILAQFVEVVVQRGGTPLAVIVRCQQEAALAVGPAVFIPQQQFPVVAARYPGQLRDKHTIEFQSLGLVQRHNLDFAPGFAPVHELFFQSPFQPGDIQAQALLVGLLQQLEKTLRISQRTGIGSGCRPAQVEPCLLHPGAQPQAVALIPRPPHDGYQARHPGPAVGAEGLAQGLVLQRRPDRRKRGGIAPATYQEQVCQAHAAPGCAQQRHPGKPVDVAGQRPAKAHQVADQG